MGWKPTDSDLDAIFDAALSFAKGNDTLDAAASSLASNTRMKPPTARRYVQSLAAMLLGRTFTTNMSANAIGYFLDKIHHHFGPTELQNSLRALNTHIEYYETKNDKKAVSLRMIHDSFSSKI